MRGAVRNKERCKRRRTPTQDPSTYRDGDGQVGGGDLALRPLAAPAAVPAAEVALDGVSVPGEGAVGRGAATLRIHLDEARDRVVGRGLLAAHELVRVVRRLRRAARKWGQY